MEFEKPLGPDPFIAGAGAGAGAEAAKGLAPPEEKLKAAAEGGCGLKLEPTFALSPPNEGKDELAKALFGVGACAGGKLLVALPPNAPPPGVDCCCEPKPNELAELSPMGAVAPKLKPEDCCCCCWGMPKLALCERP